MKKLFAFLFCSLMLLGISGCSSSSDSVSSSIHGGGTDGGGSGDGSGDSSGGISGELPYEAGSSHEKVLALAAEYLTAAREKTDAGMVLQGEYFYGLAQGALSSMRFAVENVIDMKDNTKSLSDITDGSPYNNWDDIVSSSINSFFPAFFEGLVADFGGKTQIAQTLYKHAKSNSLYTQYDFKYLNSMSLENLNLLRAKVLKEEITVYREYTPRTELCTSTRTGAEYSPKYHLILAKKAQDEGHEYLAWRSARNALMANPVQAELYGSAVSYGLNAGASLEAVSILNEGLLVFPNDEGLNYLAGALSLSNGDTQSASTFLSKCSSAANIQVRNGCQSLINMIGGM